MKRLEPQTNKRFNSLDGLRAFSAIGIVLMHIKANTRFDIDGFIYKDLISSFTHLVYLFMIVSAFSMFCGYYDKFKNNSVDIIEFYKRRYLRILPFFAVLVVIDILISPSAQSIAQGIADLSLLFGLLPNNTLSVIGVGWFLGVVFLFYLLFPFFCFLLRKKSSAWFTLVLTVVLHYCCELFLFKGDNVGSAFVTRNNFLYCMMYFAAGGLIYLYKDNLIPFAHRFRYLMIVVILASTVPYFVFKEKLDALHLSPMYYLVFFSLITIYAISTSGIILNNPAVKFLSKISMEIYLSHMLLFRVCEKLHIIQLFGDGWLSYIFVSAVVIALTIGFAFCLRKLIDYCTDKILNK